jgi:peroxiredoxin
MVKTASTMLPLGTEAPDFELVNIDGGTVRRSDFCGRALVVIFMCNHCPFVKHLADHLAAQTKAWQELGVAVVGISSNDADAYPADSPDEMKVEAEQRGYGFPYLFDADQSVAKAYRAACTPDFYLFDSEHKLVYRGQYDASRPGNEIEITGEDLDRAVRQVAAGQEVDQQQIPSIGCNIKWKPDDAPEYFDPKGTG